MTTALLTALAPHSVEQLGSDSLLYCWVCSDFFPWFLSVLRVYVYASESCVERSWKGHFVQKCDATCLTSSNATILPQDCPCHLILHRRNLACALRQSRDLNIYCHSDIVDNPAILQLINSCLVCRATTGLFCTVKTNLCPFCIATLPPRLMLHASRP